MLMVVTVCLAAACRDIVMPFPPQHPALCAMQHLTAQILVAPRLASGERVEAIRCVFGEPV